MIRIMGIVTGGTCADCGLVHSACGASDSLVNVALAAKHIHAGSLQHYPGGCTRSADVVARQTVVLHRLVDRSSLDFVLVALNALR